MNEKGFLGWVISLIALALLIISGFILAQNLPKSIPGELIYPIKSISENLYRAIYDLDYAGKAIAYIELSDTRLNEVRILVDQKKDDKIRETLDLCILMQKKALENIERAQANTVNVTIQLSKINSILDKEQNILQELKYQVQPQFYDAFDSAIASTADNLVRINSLRGR